MGKLRKILLVTAAVILAAYVIFAGVLYRPASDRVVSNHPVIVIEDSTDHPFVTVAEVQQLIKRNGLKLEGIPASGILLDSIERVVESHPMVRKAECCLLPSGKVKVMVAERIPVMRLMPAWGGVHYLDEDGRPMDIPSRLVNDQIRDLPLAIGKISMTDTVTLAALFDVALQLRKETYWDHMIKKIEVDDKGRWILHPTEGNFDIRLGYPEDFSVKLGAVRSFYNKILPKVGPDYYSHLNLEFKDQLICTRRKK